MISSQLNTTHTFKVSERPFVPPLWSHCPPKSVHSSLTQLHVQSVFISQRCSEEGRPEIHLSQIFRSFYQQMVWLSFHTNFLLTCWGSSHSQLRRKSCLVVCLTVEVHLCHHKSRRHSAMPGLSIINQQVLEERPALVFFLHNYCLFGIGGEVELSYF